MLRWQQRNNTVNRNTQRNDDEKEWKTTWAEQSQVKYCTFGYFQKKVNIKNEEITKKLNAQCTLHTQHRNDCTRYNNNNSNKNPNFVYTNILLYQHQQITESDHDETSFRMYFDFCSGIYACVLCSLYG